MALNFKHIKERAMQCIDTHDIDEMKRLQDMIEGECGNSLSLCHNTIENEKVFALVDFRDHDFSLADFYIHSHNTGDGMKSKYFRDMFMTGDGGHFVACICRWLANNSERVEYDTPQLLCLYTALRNERAFLGDDTGQEVESQQGEEDDLSQLKEYFKNGDDMKAFVYKSGRLKGKKYVVAPIARIYYECKGDSLLTRKDRRDELGEILKRLGIIPHKTSPHTIRNNFNK